MVYKCCIISITVVLVKVSITFGKRMILPHFTHYQMWEFYLNIEFVVYNINYKFLR